MASVREMIEAVVSSINGRTEHPRDVPYRESCLVESARLLHKKEVTTATEAMFGNPTLKQLEESVKRLVEAQTASLDKHRREYEAFREQELLHRIQQERQREEAMRRGLERQQRIHSSRPFTITPRSPESLWT